MKEYVIYEHKIKDSGKSYRGISGNYPKRTR